MSTFWLIATAIIKIVFVLLVVVGAFAPLLIWAERRQSAMMQDRVGPHRAGFSLPAGIVDFMDSLRMPMHLGALASFAGAALMAFFVFLVLPFTEDHTLFGQEAKLFYVAILAFALLGAALSVGYKAHTALVKSKGHIALLGMLHPLADALKFIFKEDFVPPKADKLLFSLAPIITLIPAIAGFAVIPFADLLYLDYWDAVLPRDGVIGGAVMPMQIAQLDIGILFVFAIAGTGVIGAALGGYASDNKFSLMGGIRAASQMVSYEVALGLTIVPAFMLYGTLRLEDMALWQSESGWWGAFIPPLTVSFILFFTCSIAETKRVPFDAPEGESELVGGYLTEYSGMKFGLFFMSEFVEVVLLSALATVIFFGGWDVPFLYRSGFDLPGTWEFVVPMTDWVVSDTIPLLHWGVVTIQVVAVLVKIIAFIFIQLTIRWTLPRFRYDQIMALCWKGILPLSLVNILFTGILILLWGN